MFNVCWCLPGQDCRLYIVASVLAQITEPGLWSIELASLKHVGVRRATPRSIANQARGKFRVYGLVC